MVSTYLVHLLLGSSPHRASFTLPREQILNLNAAIAPVPAAAAVAGGDGNNNNDVNN